MSTSAKQGLLFFFCLPMEDFRTNFTSDVLLGIFSMIPMDVSLQDLERLLQREGESTQREHRLGWSWHGSNAWNASPSQCDDLPWKTRLGGFCTGCFWLSAWNQEFWLKNHWQKSEFAPCASGVNYIVTWHHQTARGVDTKGWGKGTTKDTEGCVILSTFTFVRSWAMELNLCGRMF